MPTFNDARVRTANDRPVNPAGRYVLYWMQAVRRLTANHALDYALHWSKHLKKPLVVYEGLKLDYPWAAARHHTFMLQGIRDNAATARTLGVAYWPFVATPDSPGRGLVRRLASDACLVVTDDYPGFIVPAHNRAVGAACEVAVHLIDGNGLVPLSLLGAAVPAAVHLRRRIHKLFAQAWGSRAASQPDVPKVARSKLDAPFEAWNPKQDVARLVGSLPIDQTVPPVPGIEGGSVAARQVLDEFVETKLRHYAEGRNQPDDPARTAASRLSPYLRHGHVGIQEVAEAVFDRLGDWSPDDIDTAAVARRDDFYCHDANVNEFLDEAVTWRDVGYHWHFATAATREPRPKRAKNISWHKGKSVPQFNFETFDFSSGGDQTLDVVLPEWAKTTLTRHATDPRETVYALDDFEAAATHDDLWNAAQRELVATGRIHNYLRMLWGKKVLEWSKTPADAYRVLEHLNNKYALDGRDPNSYTGILWCFGLFDRPWAPERPVFGTVRFMSSASTAKKFKLAGYHEYVLQLPTVDQVRTGETASRPGTLF